jgi:von Willebrand factor type A domain
MPDGVAKERTEDLLQAVNKSNSSADQSPANGNSQTNAANAQSQAPNGSASSADDPGSTGGGDLASGRTAARLPETDTTPLFDPQQSGTNVVFVLDRSLSMMGEKSLAARRELVKTLHHLGTNTSFYILLFPYMAMPARGPLPATRENVDSMGGWLFSVGHRMGSDPVKSMTKALQFNPTTVWLLSDGKFSTSAANAIRSANEPVNAKIQTIGFYSREGETVLRQIASENHGIYRFVPPPGQTATNGVTF